MPSYAPPPPSLLKSKRYILFWISSLLSNVGTWMQQVAQPWVMLTISHSSFLVGFDSFAMNAPGWILTLWGGSLADRLDRKKIILFFQGLQFLAIILLVTLLALGILQPWMLILISLAVGTTDSLSMPSFQTIVPSLVSTAEIPRAVSLNSIQFNLARTVGPAIAGIVMLKFGALACIGANAISFIPFFLSIFLIYPTHGFKAQTQDKDGSNISVPTTIKEILSHDGIRNLLLATFITALFCSPIITFCPVLIRDIFTGQVRDFGFASTAFGLGGLVGAILALIFSTKFKAKSPSFLGFLTGLVVCSTALNRSLGVLIIFMAVAGALLTMTNTAANSNIQMKATNQVRGQYASLYQLAFRGGIALGGILTGLMVSGLGIKTAFLINGLLAVVMQLALIVKTERDKLSSKTRS